jgi:hypothetical protein
MRAAWVLGLQLLVLAAGDVEAQAPRPDRLVGYGIVNHWHAVDPERLAARLAASGLNFTLVEYVPGEWADMDTGPEPDGILPVVRRQLPHFIRAMRAREIWTLVSLVNANGSRQRTKADAWFRGQLEFIRTAVGPDRVILQSVSETQGTREEMLKMEDWTRAVAFDWPGEKSYYGVKLPGHLLDFHPCDPPRPPGAPPKVIWPPGSETIVNTDCLELIEYLNGWRAHRDAERARGGPADTERVRAYVRDVLRTGVHFMYYGFQNRAIDEAALAGIALGMKDAGVRVRRGP